MPYDLLVRIPIILHKIFVLLLYPSKIFMIYWTFAVVNLTLVDLPGLTKVAVGKQQIDMYLLSMVFLQPHGNRSSFIMKSAVLTYGCLFCRGST